MRISDWSSDVCSSDLDGGRVHRPDSIGGAGGVCRAGSIYGAGGVPGAGTDLLGAHQHPGDAVLDALELPDPPAELLPRAGVVARGRGGPVGDAGGLGTQHDGGQVEGSLRDDVEYVVPWRSEARRVGKECVSACRSRWSPDT